jgi:hypothetical protein
MRLMENNRHNLSPFPRFRVKMCPVALLDIIDLCGTTPTYQDVCASANESEMDAASVCIVCGDGQAGSLANPSYLLCSHVHANGEACHEGAHIGCMHLPSVPHGDWFCWRHDAGTPTKNSGTCYSPTEGFSSEVRVAVRCGGRNALLHLPPRYVFNKKATQSRSRPFVISGSDGARTRHTTTNFEAFGGASSARNWLKTFKIQFGDKWISVAQWMKAKKWKGKKMKRAESKLVAQSVFLFEGKYAAEEQHSAIRSDGLHGLAVVAHVESTV